MVNGALTTEETQAVLGTRRLEIREELERGSRHLEVIDQYIADLEAPSVPFTDDEPSPSDLDVVVKTVPVRLLAQVADVADSWNPADIGPVIAPLYPRLIAALDAVDVPFGQSMAWYRDSEDERIAVHATVELSGRPTVAIGGGVEVVELPGHSMVAATVHHGPMENCDGTYRSLLGWIAANGYRTLDYGREIDLDCGPDREWITEVQIPVAYAAASGADR